MRFFLIIIVFSFILMANFVAEAGSISSAPIVIGEALPTTPEKHAEPGMFDINWGILVSQTINFFVLLHLLTRFLYEPINKIIEERIKFIKQNIEDAEMKNAECQKLKAEYEKKLEQINEEAHKIKQTAIAEAEKVASTIIANAKEERDKIIQTGLQQLHIEKQKAWTELREKVVNLALRSTEKVIDKVLDDQLHHELVQKAILQLEQEC